MTHKKPLPELYAYILRNVLRRSGEGNITTTYSILKSIKKVVYKAPMSVFREIIKEFCEDYKTLKKLDKTNFRIQLSKEVQKQLRKLNDQIFPIRI